ncbi:MAG TPA: SUMF1/EgtB/PvdO family nonheme iron enzyme [Labilithrix sp.]
MKRGLVIASLLAACGTTVKVEPPPGQILLYIDTDAPLGRAGGARAPKTEPAALFDRLRIEVFAPDATTPCDGCVNEFAIDADAMRALGVSIGVAPTPDTSGFRAHVRMFLAAHEKAGEPDPDGTIDSTIALPAVEATGTKIVTLHLRTDDVGARKGSLDAPIDPDDGPPDQSEVGTWPRAARAMCAGQPGPGEVCVPGGAFWMGGRRGPWSFLPGLDTLPPRLVVLAPFYLDAHEVTVADFRTNLPGGAILHWSGKNDGTSIDDYCDFTTTTDRKDDFPANCEPWTTAKAYCQKLGKDLPTEAQMEYVSSGLDGTTFVWGEDPPACEDAVFSRVGFGIFSSAVTYCKTAAPPGGPQAIGSGARDRLDLPGGSVIDLVGNVTEWAQDQWNLHNEPCWRRAGVYTDPVCETPSTAAGMNKLRAVHGGDWLVTGGQLAYTVRISALGIGGYFSPEVGFRCMRK